MKRALILCICILLNGGLNAQTGKYRSEKVLTWSKALNEPFFVEGREITKLLIEAALEDNLTPYEFSTGKKPAEIDKKTFIKRLNLIDQENAWIPEEGELSGSGFDMDLFDQVYYKLRIVEEVTTKGKDLSRLKPLYIDLLYNMDYLFGLDVDDKIARFKFRDSKKVFKKDERALWINPYNNAHQVGYYKALTNNFYIPDEIYIYHPEKGIVFSGGADGKTEWIYGKNEGLEPISEFVDYKKRIRNPGYNKDFYRWYIIELLVDLKKSLDLDRNKRVKLINEIYIAGKKGEVSFFIPESPFWDERRILSPEEFVREFQFELYDETDESLDEKSGDPDQNKYEFITPVDSLYQMMLVGEIKIDSSGIKSYHPKYLGLIISSEQSPTGLFRHTAYTDIKNLEIILSEVVVGDRSFFDLLKSPESDATRYIHLTNIFKGSYSITYDSFTDKIWSSQIPEFVDLELFRNEIYTGR